MFPIALQHVGRDDLGVMTGNGRQRQPTRCRIAGGIDRRIGCALQKFVELEAPLLVRYSSCVEIQTLEIGHPAGCMNG